MADLSIAAIAVVDVIEMETAPAAEAITAGQACRYDTSSGKFTKANGSSAAEARCVGVAVTSAIAGMPVTVLRRGLADLGEALVSLAYDADVYLSNTDGTLADAAGTASKIVGQVRGGFAHTTADKLLYVNC